MCYRKPEEFKETDVEWIPRIPKEWNLRKLKFLSNVNSSNVNKKSKEDEIAVELCNYTDVYYNEFITNALDFMEATASDKDIERFQLVEGDVIITKDSESQEDMAVPTFVEETKENLLCGYHLALIRSDKNVLNGKYLFRLFQSKKYREEFGIRSNGITRYGLGVHELKNVSIYIPPLSEQRSIAAFLDRKTEAIDQLIEKKEHLIERLKEKRQALITQAVTKGLDTDVSMKDSGVEWLGEIPEDWQVVKFNRIGKQVSGGTPKKDELDYWNGNIPWVSPKDFKKDFLNNSEDYITEAGLKNSSAKLIPEGSLLMVVRSGVLRHTLPVAVNTVELAINQDVKAVIFRSFANSNYFKYLMKAYNNILLTLIRKEGTTVESIESDYLNNLWIPLPPEETQTEIVNYVTQKTNAYQDILDGIERTIKKLKEYRQSLISAAVTGKIDVREEAEISEKENTWTANVYFKRRVLAAKILDDLHQEPTLGRRKLQKILYLLEKEIEAVELKGKYQKDAAGPFDNKMMRSIESQLEKAEWFKRVKRENGYGYKYLPMIKKDEYKEYYIRYWENINDEVEELIELLRPGKTNLLSLVATLYACWNDFLIKDEEFDGKKLIYESRHNWHEEKKEIPNEDWVEALNWMWDNGLKPEGVGELTREKN